MYTISIDILSLASDAAVNSQYIFLFFLYLIGGPIPNFVTSVIAAGGSLNITTVFLLVMLAELTGDIIYHGLGRFVPRGWMDRKVSDHENNKILKEFNGAIVKHPFLALSLIKVTSVVAGPGLFIVGRKKILSWKRYLIMVFWISLIKNIIICGVGYGTGMQLDKFKEMYNVFTYIMLLVLLAIILLFILKANKDRIEKTLIKQMRKLNT